MNSGRSVTIDTHVHTVASYDGEMHPETLLNTAEAVGLDAIVITDHDTLEGARVAATLAEDRDIVVIKGCEVSTSDGHLLAMGLEEAPAPSEPLAATAQAIRRAGGVAVVPHPFQRSRHGARASAISDVDGVEVHNAHTLFNLRNEQAKRFARQERYPMFGGSDAHRPQNVGLAATQVRLPEQRTLTPRSLLKTMRAGRTRAVGNRTPTWQYVSKLVANARYKTATML
jgi:predicted metal-dependent phosphoesterase TrpH